MGELLRLFEASLPLKESGRCKLRVTSYELRASSHEPRVTRYVLRVPRHELRVTSHELRVTSCELRATRVTSSTATFQEREAMVNAMHAQASAKRLEEEEDRAIADEAAAERG